MTSWRTPELDDDAADAVALMALYTTGSTIDADLAAGLLDHLTRQRDGVTRTIGGLVSLCAALLALQEFDTGLAAGEALQRAALVIQEALPA